VSKVLRIAHLLCCCGSCTFAAAALGADFSDRFADREVLTGESATITGNNVNASVESGEPLHAGKVGGHSVWISWIAPTNGLVTFTTAGSTFDTLLAVYTLASGSDSSLERLREAAEDDDDDDDLSPSGAVQFGARAGVRYEIAVDGFAGATGDILLQLNLLTLADLLPQIVRRPGDIAVREGDTLVLTMDVNRQAVPHLEMNWNFNGTNLDEYDQPSLTIRNFQDTNAGTYRLRLVVGDTRFYSPPVEVQINSEGQTNALARNKIEDAQMSGLTPVDGSGNIKVKSAKLGGGVTRGYNGSQVFNTTYATRDPLEPQHCGIPGGPTYWFSYQPPDNGILFLNTDGSSYDTLLAVYTSDNPPTGYADLIEVACDNNSGSNGLTSALQFSADKSRTYYIVVDGVNGARGTARLNYSLTVINPPPPAPVITRQPASQTLAIGNLAALDVVASGASPLSFQWFRNGNPMASQTNATLNLSGQPSSAGTYYVTVTNISGMTSSASATVKVISRPTINFSADSHTASMAFPATRGFQYRVEYCGHLQTNGRYLFTNVLTDAAGMIWITDTTDAANIQFYRLIGP